MNNVSFIIKIISGKHPVQAPRPINSTDGNMPESCIKAITQQADIRGWPMVNPFNRSKTITKTPHPALDGAWRYIAKYQSTALEDQTADSLVMSDILFLVV